MKTDNLPTTVSEITNTLDSLSLTNKQIALKQLNEIINLLPNEISDFIEDVFIYKRVPKEYTLVSLLFAFSNAVGLAFNIKHSNYTNYSNLYFAIIGNRGDVKSEAISMATDILNKKDCNNYKEYVKNKTFGSEIPNGDISLKRKQFFIQNATIESAMYVHYKNPYSVGLLIDELSYLFEKMVEKNTSGIEWRTFLLQGNTNKHIDVSRKTTESYRLDKSYPTLLGSLQKQFIPKIFANGNLESGLIDRLIFVNKLTENLTVNRKELPKKTIENYNKSLENLLETRIFIEDEVGYSKNIEFSIKANDKLAEYYQELIFRQKKTFGNLGEYLSKSQISLHKLTLLLHLIINSKNNDYESLISESTVDLAYLLNEFFLTNFKIIEEYKEEKISNKTLREEIIKTAIKNNCPQTHIVDLLGISKGYVSKLFKRFSK